MLSQRGGNSKLVAMGYPTTAEQRQLLAMVLGTQWTVLDLCVAPASTDLVLIQRVSPRAVERLRHQFPQARLLVIEMVGEDHGPDICRCLSAGANAHLLIRDAFDLAEAISANCGRSLRTAA